MQHPASLSLFRTGWSADYGDACGFRRDSGRVLRKGRTVEEVAQSFPTVPLSHIYGAIAYYDEHKELIDEYFAKGDRVEDSFPPLSQRHPELFARLEAARKRLQL